MKLSARPFSMNVLPNIFLGVASENPMTSFIKIIHSNIPVIC
jgi:hypothetical protein